MGRIIKKIVLTGGPCAGKSSSLELIEKYLKNKGYIVYIVQESATELINSGIKPFGDDKIDMIKFQEIILKYQLDKENLIEKVAEYLNSKKNIVIIYDRGLIDNKAFIGQKEFDKILDKYNLNEMDILDRYDVIIHLESAAKGKGYTKENNKARSENKEEAILLDSKTFDAWKYHKYLFKVKCFDDFKDKQNEIINILNNIFDKNIRKQRKYLLSDFNYSLNDSEIFNIKQYYLDIDNIYEYRLREQRYKGVSNYYYTVQKKESNGISIIIEDKKISKNDFNDLLINNVIKKEIKKIRKNFVFEDKKYIVDIFEDGKVILESVDECFDCNKFHVIKDVTNDKKYLNVNLGFNFKRLILN